MTLFNCHGAAIEKRALTQFLFYWLTPLSIPTPTFIRTFFSLQIHQLARSSSVSSQYPSFPFSISWFCFISEENWRKMRNKWLLFTFFAELLRLDRWKIIWLSRVKNFTVFSLLVLSFFESLCCQLLLLEVDLHRMFVICIWFGASMGIL